MSSNLRDALARLEAIVHITLDKDFGFWSSPAQNERRAELYPAWVQAKEALASTPMPDEVKLLPCDLDDATAEQIERANEAVGYNMNEDGTPKWQSAQGYACALAAIMLSDSSASRICNALAEFATFADDFPQDAPNTTSVQGTLGMCRRAKALLATRPAAALRARAALHQEGINGTA